MLSGIIIAGIWSWVQSFFIMFWSWIVGGAVALLAFLFSATIRKYTIGVICVLAILFGTYLYGYNSNDNVQVKPPTCQSFRDNLIKGPATDKVIVIFKRKGLCV